MRLRTAIGAIKTIKVSADVEPSATKDLIKTLPSAARGSAFAKRWTAANSGLNSAIDETAANNPLRTFFEERKVGRGIWKWVHYFDAYHRHLQKFIGREVHIVEIGVFSGGSLEMWKSYFGDKCHIYGVDIETVCKAYDNDSTKIYIGDQADRHFWNDFKHQVPRVDIVIDDGGHLPEQQRVTLEELLPHIQPGGVFLCEDIHGDPNDFASYVYGLAAELNSLNIVVDTEKNELRTGTTCFQRDVNSVHLYPYLTVIEKNRAPVAELACPKHGTEWQPINNVLLPS